MTAPKPNPPLSPRQELLLRLVVEAHISSGQPVGSKTLVQAGLVEAGSAEHDYGVSLTPAGDGIDAKRTAALRNGAGEC